MEDLSIKTGTEIRKIDVESMASTDGVQDVIQSRRAKTFKSAGFVDGVDLLVSRKFGSFTAASMRRTNLLVGVDADGVNCPALQATSSTGSASSAASSSRGCAAVTLRPS